MRALIIGGGIGGLATAVALQRIGVEAAVFERASEITEVGAGLSLWSNAVLAARRLGIESQIVAAGSLIEKTRSLRPSGEALDEFDFAALGKTAGAPSLCIHRAELQRILLTAALAHDPGSVRTGRECIGCDEGGGSVNAVFADGTRERGDVLIGADGIHSIVRRSLFDDAAPRYAGYWAWRGIADGLGAVLPEGEALFVIGRGTQAGLFPCGGGRTYWFLTSNGPPGSKPGPQGDRTDMISLVKDWHVPVRRFVEATHERATLRNDILDRPPQQAWGRGRMTLLGDAIHPTTPNLGQGACQTMEDAVILAHSLRSGASPEEGLRDYEVRRAVRTKFVTEQSLRLGKIFQMANPAGVWLRDAITKTRYAERQSQRLFERLLVTDLPELDG